MNWTRFRKRIFRSHVLPEHHDVKMSYHPVFFVSLRGSRLTPWTRNPFPRLAALSFGLRQHGGLIWLVGAPSPILFGDGRFVAPRLQ